MQDFMLLFRSEEGPDFHPSPEEFQAELKLWENWIGGIAAQGKLVGSEALDYDGKVLHANGTITDGPFTEVKEIIGGYTTVKASGIEEALQLAQGCPVFASGGTVEIRPVMNLE